METKELSELLLAAIYYETENIGHTYIFFSLQEVATTLGAGEMTNIVEAAQLLESRGFALLSQGSPSDIGIMITNDGCLFAEQGGETGIISEYGEYREKIGAAQSTRDQAGDHVPPTPCGEPLCEAVSHVVPGVTYHSIIMEIMHILINDSSLDMETRDYLLKDVDALHIQLSKEMRNMKLIETLLNNLGNQPPISHLIAQLTSFTLRS
ncbi:MAG: hypothetical protein A4E64_01110 [Syntrophorhabdus sp. PtaU1.Bin058]|nr:MAG: hypothetical protein A4E64_01110 [Syntrophorhabdus sp. PtaU1.Bin058]